MDARVRKVTRRIYLSSNSADRFPFGKNRTDNVIFDFITPIVCRNSQQIFMSLESFSAPNLAYNVNDTDDSGNNILITNRGTVFINPGNYTSIQQLLIALNAKLDAINAGCIVLYDALANKVEFENTENTVLEILPGNNTLFYQLGLNKDETLLVSIGKKLAPRQVDLSSGRAINFCITNFDFNAIDSFGISTQTSSILASIPLSVGFGQIQTYSDYDVAETMTLANSKNISELDIRLLNLDNTPFDIGGTQWSAVILVTIAG